MSCRNMLGAVDSARIGIALADAVAPHEKELHEERPCWHGRVEIVAYVAHVLGLRPQDMGKVSERIGAHLEDCRCPPRPVPPEGW